MKNMFLRTFCLEPMCTSIVAGTVKCQDVSLEPLMAYQNLTITHAKSSSLQLEKAQPSNPGMSNVSVISPSWPVFFFLVFPSSTYHFAILFSNL